MSPENPGLVEMLVLVLRIQIHFFCSNPDPVFYAQFRVRYYSERSDPELELDVKPLKPFSSIIYRPEAIKKNFFQ